MLYFYSNSTGLVSSPRNLSLKTTRFKICYLTKTAYNVESYLLINKKKIAIGGGWKRNKKRKKLRDSLACRSFLLYNVCVLLQCDFSVCVCVCFFQSRNSSYKTVMYDCETAASVIKRGTKRGTSVMMWSLFSNLCLSFLLPQ